MLVRALSRKCGVKIEPQTESAARVRRPGLEVGTDCFRGLSRFTRLARGFAVGGGTPYRFAMGSDVGAIWASLKAKTAPSQHAARAKALLRDARGDSSSQSTTRADRRRDASGTRPPPVTGARGAEATDTDDPERNASELSSREARDVETEDASSPRPSSDPSASGVVDGSGKTNGGVPSSGQKSDAVVATEDALRRLTARDLNALADTESAPQTRVRALRCVREVLDTRVEPPLLAATAAELFLKPFLRRLEDASERCRESAADALAALVRGIAACPRDDERSAVLDLLPYAVPVLRDRLGPAREALSDATDALSAETSGEPSAGSLPRRADPREPSEEIRVKLHRVFCHLLVHASESSSNSLAAYASDAVLVLQFTAEDAFWEVALEACALLQALCDALGRRLSPVAKKLAWTFAPNLTHRRSKVRVATLRALRALMHCGAHETILDLCAFKHPNLVPIKAFYGEDRKVNYFGKLALDPCAPVRLAFVHTLGDWMTTLVERTDHEPRLLPYVMSAAADEAPEVRDAALALLTALGAQYEKEHEKDLKATMTYAPEHFGAPEALGVFETETDSDSTEEATFLRAEPRVLAYPPPFASRPGLGVRVLVKNHFPSVVNPILAEMMGWQEDARVRAAKLLRANLVFLEENATQHCQQLCSAFVKVCAATSRDAATRASRESVANEGVASEKRSDALFNGARGKEKDSAASRAADVEALTAQCCALVGAFVRPNEWLEVLLERCGPGNESATVAGALAVLAECCAGAAAEDMLLRDVGRARNEARARSASVLQDEGTNATNATLCGETKDDATTRCPLDRILDVLELSSLVGSSDTAARCSVCRFAETVLSRRPRTWGGDGGARGNRRLARLLGAALRAGAPREGEDDETAAPARACRAAFAAAARAERKNAFSTGTETEPSFARSDDSLAIQSSVTARLRGELLAPLAALPRGAWRAHDAAALVAICGSAGAKTGGGTAFAETDASTAIRLVALVAETAENAQKNAGAGFREGSSDHSLAALARFPFLETLESPARDEDVALAARVALSALERAVRESLETEAREERGGGFTDRRIALASSAMRGATRAIARRETCSDAAARAVAGAVAAKAVAVLETRDVAARVPALIRAETCALVAALADRVAAIARNSANAANAETTHSDFSDPGSVLAAPRVLARLVPALGARLDDADAATRAAAAAALAALAAVAPLAAYHCARAATAAHFVEPGARADARRSSAAILEAAYAAHPRAAAAAAARPEGSAGARAARAALAEELGFAVAGARDATAAASEEGFEGSAPHAAVDALDSELSELSELLRETTAAEATRFRAGAEETEETRRGDAAGAASELFGLD